jgi:hypothetical protein
MELRCLGILGFGMMVEEGKSSYKTINSLH